MSNIYVMMHGAIDKTSGSDVTIPQGVTIEFYSEWGLEMTMVTGYQVLDQAYLRNTTAGQSTSVEGEVVKNVNFAPLEVLEYQSANIFVSQADVDDGYVVFPGWDGVPNFGDLRALMADERFCQPGTVVHLIACLVANGGIGAQVAAVHGQNEQWSTQALTLYDSFKSRIEHGDIRDRMDVREEIHRLDRESQAKLMQMPKVQKLMLIEDLRELHSHYLAGTLFDKRALSLSGYAANYLSLPEDVQAEVADKFPELLAELNTVNEVTAVVTEEEIDQFAEYFAAQNWSGRLRYWCSLSQDQASAVQMGSSAIGGWVRSHERFVPLMRRILEHGSLYEIGSTPQELAEQSALNAKIDFMREVYWPLSIECSDSSFDDKFETIYDVFIEDVQNWSAQDFSICLDWWRTSTPERRKSLALSLDSSFKDDLEKAMENSVN